MSSTGIRLEDMHCRYCYAARDTTFKIRTLVQAQFLVRGRMRPAYPGTGTQQLSTRYVFFSYHVLWKRGMTSAFDGKPTN